MQLNASMRILAICLGLCVADTLAQQSPPVDLKEGLDEAKISEIMSVGYATLSNYIPAYVWGEHQFDKGPQLRTVKTLLESETDARWARILLDERVIATAREGIYRTEAGGLRTLQGVEGEAYPLNEQYRYTFAEDNTVASPLGTSATLKSIDYLYGPPTRTEKIDGNELVIHWYGFIGFCTDQGSDRIKGLSMPFAFYKFGYRDFANLLPSRPPAPPTMRQRQAPWAA